MASSWSTTEECWISGKHTFRIKDILEVTERRDKEDRVVKSGEFSIPPKGHAWERKWRIEFDLTQVCVGREFYRYLKLVSVDDKESTVKILFTLTRRDGTEKNISSSGQFRTTLTKNERYGAISADRDNDINLNSDSQDVQEDGSLVINCHLDVFCGMHTTSNKEQEKHTQQSPSVLDDLSSLLEKSHLSDFKIVCGKEIFPCHKLLLAARSDVFRAMFSHEGFEEAGNQVEIKDMTPDTVKLFLNFLYTDKLDKEDLVEHCRDLFSAADKYNVPRLMRVCEEHMLQSISVNNAASLVILAHKHSAVMLKKMAMDFIVQERRGLKEIEGWTKIKEYPELSQQMMAAFMGEKSG